MTREEVTKEIQAIKNNNVLLELPTSFGKSKQALDIMTRKNPGTILIVVPRLVLIKSWKDEFIKWELDDWLGRVTFSTYVGLSKFGIVNEELLADENHKDKPIIVLDDLCDGGSTFVELAKTVKAIDPDRKLAIWVTHMVNKLGIERLKKWYDEIYFTNSYKDWDEEITDFINQDQIRVIKVV